MTHSLLNLKSPTLGTLVYLVPTRCVGIHTDRAAVYNAARCNGIPTRRVGTRKHRHTKRLPTMALKPSKLYYLKITLADSKPSIWRWTM